MTRQLANHWIQKADFSATDYGAGDQSSVLDLLRSHPWREELELLENRQAKGEEFCSPGLGMNAGNRDILHLCAVGPGEWMIHFHYSEGYKILQLFPSSRDHAVTYDQVSTEQAERMVAEFFRGELVSLP